MTTNPSARAFVITPSDTESFVELVRGVYIGVEGDVAAVFPDDTTLTFKNLSAGTILPVVVKRINATNTTATDLIGLI